MKIKTSCYSFLALCSLLVITPSFAQEEKIHTLTYAEIDGDILEQFSQFFVILEEIRNKKAQLKHLPGKHGDLVKELDQKETTCRQMMIKTFGLPNSKRLFLVPQILAVDQKSTGLSAKLFRSSEAYAISEMLKLYQKMKSQIQLAVKLKASPERQSALKKAQLTIKDIEEKILENAKLDLTKPYTIKTVKAKICLRISQKELSLLDQTKP